MTKTQQKVQQQQTVPSDDLDAIIRAAIGQHRDPLAPASKEERRGTLALPADWPYVDVKPDYDAITARAREAARQREAAALGPALDLTTPAPKEEQPRRSHMAEINARLAQISSSPHPWD